MAPRPTGDRHLTDKQTEGGSYVVDDRRDSDNAVGDGRVHTQHSETIRGLDRILMDERTPQKPINYQ